MVLRLLLKATFLYMVVGFSIYPQTWNALSTDSSTKCSVVMWSRSVNATRDKYCTIERILLPDVTPVIDHYISDEKFNCYVDSYYKLSLKFRFTMAIDVATDQSFYGSRLFGIYFSNVTILEFKVSTDQLLLDPTFLSTGTSSWKYRSVYIENVPVRNETSIPLSFYEDASKRSGYDFEGYLELSNVTMVYVPQPNKFSPILLNTQESEVTTGSECSLSSLHARTLNQLSIANSSHRVEGTEELTALESPTVLCSIYTYHKNHANAKAVRNTWGRKCTGFLAFSDVEDTSLPTIHIPHLGEETYRNMWQKVRAMWKFVMRHYRDEYDYFLFGGDDMYYVMENLYAYLSGGEIREQRNNGKGLFLGREYFSEDKNLSYNTGGPGYLLDSNAFKTLGTTFDLCSPLYAGSIEDLIIGYCLKHLHGIVPYKTADQYNRQRWHNFAPGFLAAPLSSGFIPHKKELDNDLHLRFGENSFSRQSIAFHHVPKELMYQIDDHLYRCRKP